MAEEVDDIFKSFVSAKLEQLGLNGLENASSALEISLMKSALGSKNKEQEVDERSKKDKKRERKKKHKEEKKKRKEKKLNRLSDKELKLLNSRKTKTPQNNCNENEIKKKELNCYFETLNKLKEIEKLKINVDYKPVQNKTISSTNKPSKAIQTPAETNQTPVKTIQKTATNKVSEHFTQTPTETILQSTGTIQTPLETIQKSTVTIQAPVGTIQAPVGTIHAPVGTIQESAKTIEKPTNHEVSQIIDRTDANNVATTAACDKVIKISEKDLMKIKVLLPDIKTSLNNIEDKVKRRKRSRSRSYSHKRKSHKHRSRSRSPRRHKHRRRHRSSSRSRDRHRQHKHHRSSPVISRGDKVKLLEIAKANVLAQHKADLTIANLSHESKAMLRSGGVTVSQLTGVCQDIVEGKREVMTVADTPKHPFAVKEAAPISIKIKTHYPPAVVKPITELSKTFPVSSGSQHQRKEVLEDVYGKWEPIIKKEIKIEDKVFPEPVEQDNTMLIKDVIAQRVHAVRELQANPTNPNAIKNIVDSQQKLDRWTTSKHVPGQFLGSTGVQRLCKSEFTKGNPAWANTSSLNSGKHVEGIGKCLLQKMGWKEGESLGRNNAGMLEPLRVSVKTDRKGLASMMEGRPTPNQHPQQQPINNNNVVRDLSGKHPVSALMEICSKRRWKAPEFTLVNDNGPDHSRMFRFKVLVHDTHYQPSQSSANKKTAKATAATAALQAMGLIPK